VAFSGNLIPPTANPLLEAAVRERLARLSPGGGSYGELEPLALRLGLIANSLRPHVTRPRLLIFASDHGLAAHAEGVAHERTSATIETLLRGEAPLAVFARVAGLELQVVDCGVAETIADAPGLVARKFAFGTADARGGPAMRVEQAHAALELGMEIGERCDGFGVACAGLGRGAELSAALVIAGLTHRDLAEFIDAAPAPLRGSGDRADELSAALLGAGRITDPVELLATLGGFETAAMAGCILGLASRRRLIVVDGLAASAALLAAAHIAPAVVDYCLFARSRTSGALDRSLALFGASSLVELGLDALDGTGAALAWPLIESAALLLSNANARTVRQRSATTPEMRRP